MTTNSMKLTGLIELDELQKIQDSLALVTGVGMCVHEVDGTPITRPSNWCELCINYHRKSEIGCRRCLESDARLGARALELGHPAIDYCSSGHLVDAAAPIMVAGQYVGIITCGQVLYRSPNLDEYRNIAREIGVDEEGYLEALNKVTIISEEKFQRIVSHMCQIVNTISTLGYQRLTGERVKHELACALEDTRRMAEKLAEEKAFKQAVEANMADVLIATDNDGKWTAVNPAFEKIMGYRTEEVLGKKTPEQPFVTPRVLAELEKMWPKVFAGEVVTNVEAPYIRKDGREVILSGAEQLLRDAQGNVIGRIWTARDITEVKQREKAIEELLSFYDYSIASLSDMLFTLDKNGVTVYVNPAFEKATGFTQSDMVGKPVEEFPALPPELRPMIAQRARRGFTTVEPVSNVELELITREGRRFPVSYSASGIRNTRGDVIGEVVTVRDMTEVKKAETELKDILGQISRRDLRGRIEVAGLSGDLRMMAENANEIIGRIVAMTRQIEEEKTKFESVIENSPDLIGLLNREGRVIVMSPACEEITGYRAEELIGRVSPDLPYLTSESVEVLKPVWERISRDEIVQFDLPCRHKDGRRIVITETETALKNVEGNVAGRIFIGRDVTELREREKQLRGLQKLNEEIVQNAPIGIIRIDKELRITYANPKMVKILGFKGEDQLPTLGQRVTDLPSTISDGSVKSLTERLRSGEQVKEVVPFTSPYGKESVLSVIGVPLFNETGVFDGAVVLIQNVTKRVKAREELRSLYHISTQMMSTLDLQERLDTIAAEAAKLVNAQRASIVEITDQGDIVYRATYGHSLEAARQRQYKVTGMSIEQVLARSVEPVLVVDAQSDPHVILKEAAKEQDVTSFIRVPLRVGEKIIGFLSVSNKTRGKFSEGDLSLVSTMAGQAAIAIENSRLYEESKQGLAELRVVHDIGLKINSSLELQQVLDFIVQGAASLLNAEKVAVLMVEGEEIVYQAVYGFSPTSTRIRFKLGEGYIGRVVLTGEPAVVPDAPNDPRVSPEIVERENLRSFIHLPLKIKNKIVGILNINNKRKGNFGLKDLELASILTHQAAIAIENAQLYSQAQELAALEERVRMARDLHDSISQPLFSLILNSEVAARQLEQDPSRAKEQLLKVRQIAEQARRDLRSLISKLSPLTPETKGLENSLKNYIESIETFTEGRTEVKFDLEGTQRLPPPVQETLCRVAQEALNNVAKHSQASLVTVKIKQMPGEVELEVRDNGVGFKPGQGKGRGLPSIRERVDKAGGSLRTYSRPGVGTIITVHLPLFGGSEYDG